MTARRNKVEKIPLSSFIATDMFERFDCGNDDINIFLRDEAVEKQNSGTASTTLFVAGDRIIGFYTTHVALTHITDKVLKQPTSINTVNIAYFAVDEDFQKNHIGRKLMNLLLNDLLWMGQFIGFEAISLYSVPQSYDFYEHCGFEDAHPELAEDNSKPLYSMILPYKKLFKILD